MTTNNPEVVAYLHIDKENSEHRSVSLRHDAGCHSTLINTKPLILLSDYEALQAELARELQRRFDGNEQASREHREDMKLLVKALEEARHHVVISPDPVRGGFIQEIDAILAAHREQQETGHEM